MKRDEAIERIRKLLRLSRAKGASIGEVENALRFARRLMDQYAVEEEEALAGSEASGIPAGFVHVAGFSRAGSIAAVEQVLSSACAMICDVGACSQTRRHGKRTRVSIVFYGLAQDCQLAHFLFAELRATMRATARFRHGRGWNVKHRSYAAGFASRLSDRARAMKHASDRSPTTGAIVLRKQELVEAYRRSVLGIDGDKRKARRMKRVDPIAAAQGVMDANAVSITPRRVTSRTTAASLFGGAR